MKFYRHLVYSIAILAFIPVTHAQVTLNPNATRALGAARLEQLTGNTLTNVQPNLVEGRELNSPEGIALDLTSSPIHLYVADTSNNRVLGWKDATQFANGAFADIVIGQSDFFTTLQQGPGVRGSTRQSSGMTSPVGLTVDATGNLYVVDVGNNRVLRFPHPFAQTGDQFPDLVLGQQNFNSSTANSGGVSASTLNFGGQAYLKFDNFGNLWLADVGNQRVLRFPSAVLTAGNNGPAADLVLGQPDFSTNTVPKTYDPQSTNVLNSPTGIAFDKTGRLFVSESQAVAGVRSRILVFQPPYSSNQAAQRIIGTVVVPAGGSAPPTINESQLGAAAAGVFAINNNIAIADTTNNRILVYSPFEQFTSDVLTQKAQIALCQPDLLSGKTNRGNSDANSNTCNLPIDAAFGDANNELFIADTGNNRVIVMPMTPNSSTLGFNAATRVLGQQQFSEQAVNYIEGREFNFAPTSTAADAGIAMDLNSNPPHLYVADTYNNRILCYVDLRVVKTGGTADFVIGQPDLFHAVPNYNPNSTTSSSNTPTQTGLFHPTGLTVDAAGNLYVADSGNARVLRFPSPFTQPSKQNQPADLVLGQSSFTIKITDVSSSRMFQPYGVIFVPTVGLLVSDSVDDRVLLFPGTNFLSGMAATAVWGQSSFNTVTAGNSDNRFNGPHGIAVDSGYRLYVADTGNNRVLVFDDIRKAGPDPHSIAPIPGLTSPRAVFIDQYTPVNSTTASDEIWIGEANQAVRFSGGYAALQTANNIPDLIIPEAGGALALAVDSNSALYVADIANRVVIHYVAMAALNGASFNTLRLTVAPNTIISLFSQGGQFGAGQQSATSVPLPTTMQAIQVLLNGTPMPLYYVSPTQINFLVPNNAPTSGTADLQVLRTDNGQTLGDTSINLTTAAPGLFTMTGTGKGQAAAVNDDGSYNDSSHAIGRGHVLQVYGTGLGFIAGAPNDGSAVSTATPTTQSTAAFINGVPCPIQYSGLAPGLVGVWQVNVVIADAVVPTTSLANRTSELVVQLGGVPSGGQGLFGIQVLVWVKQ